MSVNAFIILTSLLKIVGILFIVILPTVFVFGSRAERRVSAFIQDRPGPNQALGRKDCSSADR